MSIASAEEPSRRRVTPVCPGLRQFV